MGGAPVHDENEGAVPKYEAVAIHQSVPSVSLNLKGILRLVWRLVGRWKWETGHVIVNHGKNTRSGKH